MQTLPKSRRATSINIQQPPWHLIVAGVTLSAGNKFPTNSCSFKLIIAAATFPLENPNIRLFDVASLCQHDSECKFWFDCDEWNDEELVVLIKENSNQYAQAPLEPSFYE